MLNATSAAAVVVGHLIFNARTVISRLAVFVCVCVFDDISAGWRLGLLIASQQPRCRNGGGEGDKGIGMAEMAGHDDHKAHQKVVVVISPDSLTACLPATPFPLSVTFSLPFPFFSLTVSYLSSCLCACLLTPFGRTVTQSRVVVVVVVVVTVGE